jgi:hypothetical protein
VRYSLISTTLPRPKATLTQRLPAMCATPAIVPSIRTGWPADCQAANVHVERIAGLQTLGHDRLDGGAVGEGCTPLSPAHGPPCPTSGRPFKQRSGPLARAVRGSPPEDSHRFRRICHCHTEGVRTAHTPRSRWQRRRPFLLSSDLISTAASGPHHGTLAALCACGSGGGRRVGLGAWWRGDGGAGKGREGVDVDYAPQAQAGLFDLLDGRVTRWRQNASPMGRELDSLADLISFGVAPAGIAFAAGADSWFDQGILIYFVSCGLSRLARYNVTTEALARETGKLRHFGRHSHPHPPMSPSGS